MTVLAHGGTAGAIGEIAFIVVPIAVFAVLSRVAMRRREREQADGSGGHGTGDARGA